MHVLNATTFLRLPSTSLRSIPTFKCPLNTTIRMNSTSNTHQTDSKKFKPLSPKPNKPIQPLKLLSAKQAASIDESLMSPKHGYTLQILMELAGLSVASAIYDYTFDHKNINICIVCGPGNNGGDGLVTARHLQHFGYSNISVICPRRSSKFDSLFTQLTSHNISVYNDCSAIKNVDLWIDCIFGFSFDGSKGGVRQPYKDLIDFINMDSNASIVAVDVPSGWDVDNGPVLQFDCLRVPDVVISLTAPKKFISWFENEEKQFIHYVGGRFVPQAICDEFDFRIPEYVGSSQIVRIE